MRKLVGVYRKHVPMPVRIRVRSMIMKLMGLPEAVRRLMPARAARRFGYRRNGLGPVAADGIRLLRENERVYPYQPLWRGEELRGVRPLAKTERSCQDRWAVIEPHLPRQGSFMDIGSQHGYFVFQAADHGLIAHGVERDPIAHRVAQLLAVGHGTERANFIRMDVTPETVKCLPSADVVSCMSVFHHWVREGSLDVATAVMEEIAARCRSALFFETGQNNEEGAWWASTLDFMGDDPEAWTTDYLRSLGFSSVTSLGRFAADHVAGVPRTLFLAEK